MVSQENICTLWPATMCKKYYIYIYIYVYIYSLNRKMVHLYLTLIIHIKPQLLVCLRVVQPGKYVFWGAQFEQLSLLTFKQKTCHNQWVENRNWNKMQSNNNWIKMCPNWNNLWSLQFQEFTLSAVAYIEWSSVWTSVVFAVPSIHAISSVWTTMMISSNTCDATKYSIL